MDIRRHCNWWCYWNIGCKESKDDGDARDGEYVQWNGRGLCGIDIDCRIQSSYKASPFRPGWIYPLSAAFIFRRTWGKFNWLYTGNRIGYYHGRTDHRFGFICRKHDRMGKVEWDYKRFFIQRTTYHKLSLACSSNRFIYCYHFKSWPFRC